MALGRHSDRRDTPQPHGSGNRAILDLRRLRRGAGDVGVDVVQRIADALGVSVASLFDAANSSIVNDDELSRRSTAGDDEFVDAEALLEAIDETAGPEIER